MTGELVAALHPEGTAEVLLFDNGSSPGGRRAAVEETGSLAAVELRDATGMGLHQMWNAGVHEARRRHPIVNIAILNNDLRVGAGFLSGLAAALRSDDRIQAVCPNYDHREVRDSLVPLRGICEGRYDGTGGLCGFAFMIKGEWFSNGWTFPEAPAWWFGDRMLTEEMDRAGARYAMATDVAVEHIRGGSQTSGDWNQPAVRAAVKADRDAYERRRAPLG